MTTKQCGNCKWWGSEVIDQYREYNMCLAPIPSCAIGHVEINMHKTDGRYCQVFEERKE